MFIMSGGFEGAPDHPGGHVKHVNRAEDDSECGEGAEGNAEVWGSEGAEDGEKLGDEAIQAGKANAAEREEDEEEGHDGHPARQAGKLVDVAGVVAVVDHADDKEEGAGGEAV